MATAQWFIVVEKSLCVVRHKTRWQEEQANKIPSDPNSAPVTAADTQS